MTRELPRDFKGIWISRELWLCEDLSHLERILWCEINSLYDRERGGCYASNEALCVFMKTKERNLQYMLRRLEKKGYLRVEYVNHQRYLIAIMKTEEVKPKGLRRLGCKKLHHEVQKVASGGASSCSSPHIDIENKEENKEEKESAPAAPTLQPSVDSLQEKEKKIQPCENIELLESQLQELIAKHGEEITLAACKALAEWKQDKSAKEIKKATDYGRLKKWVILSVKEARLKERELSAREERVKKMESSENSNFAWKTANEVLVNKYKQKHSRELQHIKIRGNYVINTNDLNKEIFLMMEPKAFEDLFFRFVGAEAV